MSATESDDHDEKLIAILQQNGRQSTRAMAQALGLAEATVRKRLRRLVEDGTISYGLVMDVRATEMGVSGYLDVEASPAHMLETASLISEMDLCAMCCIVTGTANIRAYVYATDSEAMAQTIDELSQRPGVLNIQFREASGHAQHRYGLIMPDRRARKRWKSHAR